MQKSINAIRFLGLDMVNKAKSGHQGIVLGAAPIMYTLFTRHLKVTPNSTDWFDRDRFVLSAGHGSALLYATLHLSGYELDIQQLKNFRQLNSETPGHPEYGDTDGVEATTGPLGQGIGNAVGMALAETYLRNTFNKPKFDVINHYTYTLCGDGDLQEGVALEALSLAGHLKLSRLIVLYDSNDVQLDGPTSEAITVDMRQKMESMGWDYARVDDANDIDAIDEAITAAKKTDQPSFIEIKSVIGYGAEAAGTNKAHGNPVDDEEVEKLRKQFDYPNGPFEVSDDVYRDFFENVVRKNEPYHVAWQEKMDDYRELYPEQFEQLEDMMQRETSIDFEKIMSKVDLGHQEATRASIGRILPELSEQMPSMIGGSADLSGSTKVKGINGDFTAESRTGRNINFGVREHAMAAITNGLVLHKLRAFAGGFLIFSDYMKPSIRLSALMKIPSVFIFTHDSVAVGEDGPTHQPVEQLAVMRSTPHLVTMRPAHALEVRHAARYAFSSKRTPVALVLTRQATTVTTDIDYDTFKKGAYVAADAENFQGVIVASGSELELALQAKDALAKEDIAVRVVSMPSMELFLKQPEKFRESILPKDKTTLAVELGAPGLWYRFADDVLGVESFGKSAPGNEVQKAFGFTAAHVAARFKSLL